MSLCSSQVLSENTSHIPESFPEWRGFAPWTEFATILIKSLENEKNRKRKDKFSVFALFWLFFENHVMMTHLLRSFISLFFIMSIIKMIYMRLQVD